MNRDQRRVVIIALFLAAGLTALIGLNIIMTNNIPVLRWAGFKFLAFAFIAAAAGFYVRAGGSR
jgi:hypothetical protein